MFMLLTTSLRPAKNIRTFCRELSNTFPNVVRVNRGKLSLEGVAEKALELDAEKVVIVDRWRGGTGKIQFFRISRRGLDVLPPLIYVKSVKLRRDFGENAARRRRIKSIAITASQRSSSEVKRLENVLSEFFGVPVLSLKEIYNREFDAAMQVLADQSNCIIITFKLIPELVEVGPQIRISHLVWELNQ
jgi:rRNA maturation protein Rpf1